VENNAISQKAPTGMAYMRVVDGTSWTDMDAEANIKFNSSDNKAGIIFRHDVGYGTYYRAQLSNNAIKLQKYADGVMVKELASVNIGFNLDNATWYKLGISAAGDRITVSLNGVPKLDVYDTDSPILSGSVSLFTDGCQAAFDDTSIKGMTSLNYIVTHPGIDSHDYGVLNSIIRSPNVALYYRF